VQRELMRLLPERAARRSLAQYETCVRVLKDELDVEPAAETTRLWEQIRHGTLTAGAPMPEAGCSRDPISGDEVVTKPRPLTTCRPS